MIRRLKNEVLSELPSKVRQRVVVELSPGKTKELQAIMTQLQGLTPLGGLPFATPFLPGVEGGRGEGSGRFESGRLLQEGYRLTGEAKIEGVLSWLQDWWEGSGGGTEREGEGGRGGGKLLVFAHHQVVLDALEGWAVRLKEGGRGGGGMVKKGGKGGGGEGGGVGGGGGRRYIRIDGSTPTLERAVLVKIFQENAQCRLAFLSLTAAGQGITLTAAGHVCFAELSYVEGEREGGKEGGREGGREERREGGRKGGRRGNEPM